MAISQSTQSQPNLPKITRSALAWVLLYLVYWVAFVSPYLNSGFFFDDNLNSQIGVVLDRLNQSSFEFALNINKNWMNGGRFYPLGFILTYGFYSVFDTLVAAKTAQALLVLSNALLLSGIVWRMSASLTLTAILAVTLPLLFQARLFFDPITAYPFMQFLLFFLLVSIFSFYEYRLARTKTAYLILGSFSFGCALLTYEVALPFAFLLAVILIAKTPARTWLKSLLPLALVLAFYASVVAFLRAGHSVGYEGIQLRLDFQSFFDAFTYQTLGSLPLNYFFSDSTLSYQTVKHFGIPSQATKLAMFLGPALLATAFIVRPNKPLVRQTPIWLLTILGLSLVLLPALTISLSKRWQTAIGPQSPYLPVYLSYFGVALLLALGLWMALNRLRELSRILTALVIALLTIGFGFAIFIQSSTNLLVIEKLNTKYKWPRIGLETAEQAGLWTGFEQADNAILLNSNGDPWVNRDFSKTMSSHVTSVLFIDPTIEPQAISSQPLNKSETIYFLVYGTMNGQLHPVYWVFLARIEPDSTGYEIVNPRYFFPDTGPANLNLAINCLGKRDRLLPTSNTKTERGTLFFISNHRCSQNLFSIEQISPQ